MNLFLVKKHSVPIKLDPLVLETPLGKLHFNCMVNGKSLSKNKQQFIESIMPETTIVSWQSEVCDIEFLRTNFIPKLPEGMKVDSCIGGIWRIKNYFNNTLFRFTCYLETTLEGSQETGEGLIALSFDKSTHRLTIGTEDEEYLKSRANSNDWLPSHLKDEISSESIHISRNEIIIDYPACFANETMQTHFIVAWGFNNNQNLSTWYAVDQSTTTILNQVDVE